MEALAIKRSHQSAEAQKHTKEFITVYTKPEKLNS
jgi:hypothetical protein